LTSPLLVSLTGMGEDFQLLTAGAGSLTITSGQTATYTLQVAPVAGSNGALTVTCSGAPAHSTCTLNPASLQMVSGTTQSLTMTVATGISTATSSLVPTSIPVGFRGWLLAFCVPLGLTGLRRRPSRKIFLALGALGLLLMCGCGTSASDGSSPTTPSAPPSQANATPSGTYTLTVTASAPGLQRTAKLTLVVE
jgi:hypothetical protein